MDLGTIQDLLADFATFGKNIGTALQNFPNLIGSIVDFFTGFEDNADNTEAAFKGLSSSEPATDEPAAERTDAPRATERPRWHSRRDMRTGTADGPADRG